MDETYRMIAEAGFEVDGNPLYAESQQEPSVSGFRLAGRDGDILRPEVARD